MGNRKPGIHICYVKGNPPSIENVDESGERALRL